MQFTWVFYDLHTIQGNNRTENLTTTCDQEMTGQNHKVQGAAALRISPPPVHKFKDWHNNQRYASSSKYHTLSTYKSCMAALPPQRNNYSKGLHTKNKSCFEANKRIICLSSLHNEGFPRFMWFIRRRIQTTFTPAGFFFPCNNVVQYHLHKQQQSD